MGGDAEGDDVTAGVHLNEDILQPLAHHNHLAEHTHTLPSWSGREKRAMFLMMQSSMPCVDSEGVKKTRQWTFFKYLFKWQHDACQCCTWSDLDEKYSLIRIWLQH